MPFTPKFVDLVRNFTTVQGSAPVALGAAVNGYTGIANALTAGDQFYYCIQGVEKPQEREVGRGTLQANGMVAREAISGGLTNFSSGTKTIALVTAAEWFGKVETAAAGGGQTSMQAATRAELAAKDPGSSPAMLAEAGREGLFVWDPSDRSAEVAADPSQGIHIAPASDPDGSSGAWVRRFDGPVRPEWFGMVPDTSAAAAANVGAWNAMMTALAAIAYEPAANFKGLLPVRFGPGEYHFSGPLDIVSGSLDISGPGAGVTAKLKFPPNSSGLRIQYYESAGTSGGAVAPHAHSAGSTIRDLAVEGGYTASGNVEGEFHGIQLRAPAYLENVQAIGFQGDGFYINAGALSGTFRGNANLFRMVNCFARQNRNGLYLAGADANAYNIDGGSFDNNRQWGFMEPDAASLGGNVRGVHFDSNGITGFGQPSVVTHGGNWYCVKHGEEAWCSANAPSGTTADNQGWVHLSAGAVGGGQPAWTSGTSYRSGGSVLAKSPNAVTKFDGCYSEPGQGLPQVDSPNWILGGGLADRRVIGSGGALRHVQGVLTSSSSFRALGSFSADGPVNAFGPIAVTGELVDFSIRSPEGFNALRWDHYSAGAKDRTNGSITAWDNPGSAGNKGLLYSADDSHFFKCGGGTFDVASHSLTIDSSGIDMASGKVFKVAGTQVVGPRGAAVADATDAASAITQLNLLLARCRAHGLIAT